MKQPSSIVLLVYSLLLILPLLLPRSEASHYLEDDLDMRETFPVEEIIADELKKADLSEKQMCFLKSGFESETNLGIVAELLRDGFPDCAAQGESEDRTEESAVSEREDAETARLALTMLRSTLIE